MGGDLPKGRESKENYGKTLKIESVSYHDRGTYRCTATNALGAATYDFHVTVEGTSPTPVTYCVPWKGECEFLPWPWVRFQGR